MIVKLKLYFTVFLLFLAFTISHAQVFKFAHITDTHVGSGTGAEDLRRAVKDINENTEIEFVIHSGDVTEFGADAEFILAKRILDSLRVPYYIIPGNHDANWSESGGNSFRKIFGAETFAFTFGGFQFVGTNSGPNMRMSPGQVPRENLVWMDSLFRTAPNSRIPLIYVNHYPQDSSLNNWFEAIDRLKQRNIQLIMLGHGHTNKAFNFEGIPAIMGRSNLRAKDTVGGYNIVTIVYGQATYQTRIPGVKTSDPWARVSLVDHHFDSETTTWPRPDYAVNERQTKVTKKWTFKDDSDLGAGLAVYKQAIITANTKGRVYALDVHTGKKKWQYQTGGKVYSTPAVWNHYVVVGSSDDFIYGLSAETGALLWKIKTEKAVLGSPIIQKGIAYIGGSDGTFRAIDIRKGREIWHFDKVSGFVSSTPLFYKNTLYFGSWGNGFYALNAKNGKLRWNWDNGYSNRMFSAAAVVPVEGHGRIFLVAPDRYMTALNAKTGQVIWRERKDSLRVRESIGISEDKETVYAKTMDGRVVGISTAANTMHVNWQSTLQLPYELTPSALLATNGLVFVPSHSGLVSAVEAGSGKVAWQYKISNAMINPITALDNQHVVVSAMDGTIVCLEYRQ